MIYRSKIDGSRESLDADHMIRLLREIFLWLSRGLQSQGLDMRLHLREANETEKQGQEGHGQKQLPHEPNSAFRSEVQAFLPRFPDRPHRPEKGNPRIERGQFDFLDF